MTVARGGGGGGRWISGTVQVCLEADAPRVACPVHGPTVASGARGLARRRAHP